MKDETDSALRQLLKEIRKRLQSLKTPTALFHLSDTQFLTLLSVVIGLVTGLGAYFFEIIIQFFFDNTLGSPSALMEAPLNLAGRWPVLVWPAIGGLAVGPLVHYLAPEAKGHGVPEIMYSLSRLGGKIKGRVAAVKILASAITIGTGGSAGREGPIAQIGAALSSKLGQKFQVSRGTLKMMVAAGAASGISAAFNAPLGGIVFSLEVILREISALPFAMVVISAVTAAAVSRTLLGSFFLFPVPPYELHHSVELIFYFILGATAGAASKYFVRILYRFEESFENWNGVHPALKPAIGGLLLGILGFYVPGVLGTGRPMIQEALINQLALGTVLVLALGKILATSITLGSGGSGGVFMPALFIGAMLGSLAGKALETIFINWGVPIQIHPGAFALAGMAACFAGAAHAPLSSILILFELTHDYGLILPVMIASVAAVLVARAMEPESIYTLKLLKKGAAWSKEGRGHVLEDTLVEDIMIRQVAALPSNLPLSELRGKISRKRFTAYPVVNEKEEIAGFLSYQEIRGALDAEPETLKNKTIKDIMRVNIPHVHPDENLEAMMQKLQNHAVDRIVVLDHDSHKKLLGIVSQADILKNLSKGL